METVIFKSFSEVIIFNNGSYLIVEYTEEIMFFENSMK